MKKHLVKIGALLLCTWSLLAFVGCQSSETQSQETHTSETQAHVCDFSISSTDTQYLKSEATCKEQAMYYYSCACGAKGEDTFAYGELKSHDFSLEVVDDAYIKTEANCQTKAEYYHSCVCGDKGETTFVYGEIQDHAYTLEIPAEIYLKAPATINSPEVYYKSCGCGRTDTATFEYGEKLMVEDGTPYMPTSLTVTLYDPANSVYGFTYNTTEAPLSPVIQVKKEGDLLWTEYVPETSSRKSFDKNNKTISYQVCKAEVTLEANTTYVYRVYDKGAGVGTEKVTFKTKDPTANAFTFVHVSDSQDGPDEFGRVLASVMDDAAFLVHTGDVVEASKYEADWTEMLDGNFEYLSKMPFMAISGNHETSYKNGSLETYKHFNHNLPRQRSKVYGYFYSFVYGDVKFIMLNTNDLTGNQLKNDQYDWLVEELKNNTCKWTIVALHNPLYSIGKYGADSSRNSIALSLQKQLQGLFVEYGVDVVLQGHDHAISRTYPINGQGVPQQETFQTVNGVNYSVDPQGVIYVMNGPAGSQNRDPFAVDDTLYAYGQSSHKASWAEFTVDGDTLTVTVKWHDGEKENVYQTWGIKKTQE